MEVHLWGDFFAVIDDFLCAGEIIAEPTSSGQWQSLIVLFNKSVSDGTQMSTLCFETVIEILMSDFDT